LSGFHYGIGQRLVHGRFEMMDACSFGFGLLAFRLVFVRLTFGYRLVSVGLVLVSLVLACLLPFGSLVVRSSGPVLDGEDDMLAAWFACLVGLDGFVGW
jgi:hypothetical protein